MEDNIPYAPRACQHHGAEYAELLTTTTDVSLSTKYDTIANGGTIVSVAITTTKRCCVIVNAATIELATTAKTAFEIERPSGTIKTTQENRTISNEIALFHHAAREVLDPGTYTYYLINRSMGELYPLAVWIKAVASDCSDT